MAYFRRGGCRRKVGHTIKCSDTSRADGHPECWVPLPEGNGWANSSKVGLQEKCRRPAHFAYPTLHFSAIARFTTGMHLSLGQLEGIARIADVGSDGETLLVVDPSRTRGARRKDKLAWVVLADHQSSHSGSHGFRRD
jgi:hypothetical protein